MIWTVFPQDDDYVPMDFATFEEAQKYADETDVECIIESCDGELV